MNEREKFEIGIFRKRQNPEEKIEKWFKNSRNTSENLSRAWKNVNKKLVLDCGCADGRLSARLVDRKAIVFAVDNDAKEIENAKQRKAAEKIKNNFFLVLADGRALPFKSNAFDFYLSYSTLEHVRKPEKYLEEMLRVLKNRGEFFLTATNGLRAERALFRLKRGIFPSIFTPYKLKKHLDNASADFCKWKSFSNTSKRIAWIKSYFGTELCVVGKKEEPKKESFPLSIKILCFLIEPIYFIPPIKKLFGRKMA